MAGSKEAYKKREQTMIKKYGSLEAYHEERRKWARKGGQNTPGLGALPVERRREIARQGNEAAQRAIARKFGAKA